MFIANTLTRMFDLGKQTGISAVYLKALAIYLTFGIMLVISYNHFSIKVFKGAEVHSRVAESISPSREMHSTVFSARGN